MEILRHTQVTRTRRHVKGRSEQSRDAMRRRGDAFMPQIRPDALEAPPGRTETPTETTDTRAARSKLRRHVR